MGTLKILADAPTQAGRNQKRGKLFEALMSDVLRRHGYRIDRIPSVNYAGMEIDIEGTHLVTTQPFCAECKCYESEIDSPKFQAFFGKFMTRWRKDKRAHGLFIAIPGLNPHARGFYNESCVNETDFTVRLLEEDAVLDALMESGKLARPDAFSRAVPATHGTAGEWDVLVTESGIAVVQRVIPPGALVPSQIAIFDGMGIPLTDSASIDKLLELEPELRSYELLILGEAQPVVPTVANDAEETIVEVKGGSECFEFQFPAAPEHFVGRSDVLAEVRELAAKIVAGTVSTRSILFEANSGWGKSSCVLACANALRVSGHSAVVIDSRSASSAQFILKVVEHALTNLGPSGARPFGKDEERITGFEGAAAMLIRLGESLREKGKLGFIFLDQFENLFFLPESFKRIRDLFLKVAGAGTHIVFGFCWKTDLVGLTNDFPYQLRDSIRSASRVIPLSKFSEAETNALLDRLSSEIRSRLREDLRFFLSEFSQGYPWLLKKLCAHVKAQRESGVSQAEIANGLLNVEQLFEDDMRGLSPEEEESLRRVAKLSPVAVGDIGDELHPQAIQSLIDRRLVVRIGTKLDIYWDIFRDYLNTGTVPAQEQFLPRLGPRSVYRACRLLSESAKPILLPQLAKHLNLSNQSTYNVIHEMRMLGLAKTADETITLLLPHVADKELLRAFTQHLGEKLRRNRLVQTLLEALKLKATMTLSEVADFLKAKCPYISASPKTWEAYGEIFCDWIEAGGLAIYDHKSERLLQLIDGRDLALRPFSTARRRGGVQALQVHYTPVETLVSAFAYFLRTRRFEWPAMKLSTREKVLSTLEDFGFVVRTPGPVRLTPEMNKFLADGADASVLLGQAALKLESFKQFVAILECRKSTKCSLLQLGQDLRAKIHADWSDGTAQTTAKIALDWARHTGLAPGVFSEPLRKPKPAVDESGQERLF